MKPSIKMLPDLLSGLRVALVPVLWVLALGGHAPAVGAGLVLAGVTDVLDGFLARRLDAATAHGAALDSLGDNLLILSGAVWLLMLRPDVTAYFAAPLIAWVALYLSFLTVGMLKFRRFGNLHLYSAKASAVVSYLFVTACFLLPGIPVLLGWSAIALAIAGVVEGLACQIACDEIDENVGSIIRVLRRRSRRRRTGTSDGAHPRSAA